MTTISILLILVENNVVDVLPLIAEDVSDVSPQYAVQSVGADSFIDVGLIEVNKP